MNALNLDGSAAAATLMASVTAAEKSPDDATVLEKARSTAFHALATLRATLMAGALEMQLVYACACIWRDVG